MEIPQTLPPRSRVLLLCFAALCITGAVYLVTTEHLLLVGWKTLHAPTMLALNLLPVLLLLFLLYALSGRLLFSVVCGAEVFLLLAVIDRVKTAMRQEPLLPTDLTLAKEAMTIVKTFPVYQLALIALLFVVFAAGLVVAFRRSACSLRAGQRVVGAVLAVACGFAANQLWYRDQGLYDGFPCAGNPYFQVNQYNTRGMIYSFLHQFNITRVTAPEGYDPAVYAALEADAPAAAAEAEYPHIIMIMGEAFSDLSENEHLDFSGYRDPLQNFKALCADANSVSGHIVVPNFGGGTSNTEYDVLTGCATRYLGSSLPSYTFIHRAFDALPNRLKTLGYETLSIHPGYAWFYNRQNVYPDLGFDTCLFLEDSFDLETQGYGGYINEEATMDKILETLDTHIQTADSPLFSFTVTIQNHGPYEKKYGTLAPNFSTDVALDETQTDLLTQYFQGIADADEQLGRLQAYAAASEEPIVLVYFGDHLPGFSNGMDFFDLLDYPIDANGSPAEQLAVYETPFLIWQNDAARALSDAAGVAAEIDLPNLLSSQFLGSTLLELLDMNGLSPLYEQNNALRRTLPVCAKTVYVDADGAYTDHISTAQQETLQLLEGWQYYKLFDEILSNE